MKAKRVLIFSLFMLCFLGKKNAQAQEAQATPYMGQISMFAGNFAPAGWAFCNGQLLSIQSNPALFSILTTTYGGDGMTTFALPDLRSRVPVHVGQGTGLSTRTLGQQWGVENVTLTTPNMPAHTHGIAVDANSAAGTTSDPSNAVLANTGSLDREYSTTSNTTMKAGSTQSTGSGTSFITSPPSLGINFIICVNGTFPNHPESE